MKRPRVEFLIYGSAMTITFFRNFLTLNFPVVCKEWDFPRFMKTTQEQIRLQENCVETANKPSLNYNNVYCRDTVLISN